MEESRDRPANREGLPGRTDVESGLTEGAARRRLAEVGPNRLPAPSRSPYVAIAARQLADPLVALLLAATAVSFLIGERLEAFVIACIVILNAVLAGAARAGRVGLDGGVASGTEDSRCGRARGCAGGPAVHGVRGHGCDVRSRACDRRRHGP